MPSRSSRNLPGFLRRTLRSAEHNLSSDDDDNVNDPVLESDEKDAAVVVVDRDQFEESGGHNNNNNNDVNDDHDAFVSSALSSSAAASHNGTVMLESDAATAGTTTTTTIVEPVNGSLISVTSPSGGGQPLRSTTATLAALPTEEIFDTMNREIMSHFHDSWQAQPPPPPPLPQQPTPTGQKSYREIKIEAVIMADVVNLAELRKVAWNGIPRIYRAQAWKLMLGYLPVNKARREQTLQRRRGEYRDAIAQHYDIDEDTRTPQEQETLRQVLVDVPRTAPQILLFRNDRIKRILSRLLYIWAMRHPASSYVQGINDLTTPLVAVFLADYFNGEEDVLDGHVMNHLPDEWLDQIEADVYWCLTNLLDGIQDHYTSDQPGVQRMVARLEELVNRIDANLCRHLRETGVEFLQFSFKWMNCLLLREFSLPCVFRLWDTYISEKDGFEGFHVYVCTAFLCQFSAPLQAMAFDELFVFFQDMPTADWTDKEIEVLLSEAYVLSTLFGGSDAHLTNNSTAR